MSRASRWSRVLWPLAVALAGACVDWDKLDPDNARTGEGGGAGGESTCEPGATLACYDGPTETEDRGACHGGVSTCRPDGSDYGACEGEVVPRDEDCSIAGDEDCDGESNELDAGCHCTPGALVDCYDGLEGTDGVGVCRRGHEMCIENGDAYTPCVGQTVPRAEECVTEADEECDGTPNAGCPDWGRLFDEDAGGDAYAWAVAATSAGISVIGGEANTPVNFGGGDIVLGGGIDAVIARFDASGQHLFSAAYGDAADQWVNDIAVDAAGNMYAVGTFAGTLAFGGTAATLTASGTSDAFVVKLSAAGVAQWATPLGVTGFTEANALDVDASGAGAFVGVFDGSVTLPGGATVSAAGSDGVVVRFDANGVLTWGTRFDGVGEDVALRSGELIVAGTFDDPIDFGGQAVAGGGGLDGFVAMLDAGNTQQWITPVGPTGDQRVLNIAADASGIYVIGECNGALAFGSVSAGTEGIDVFAAKLDSGGAPLWVQLYSGPLNQSANAIALDPAGNVWLATGHDGLARYGQGVALVEGLGDTDWFMMRLSPEGVYQRSYRFGAHLDEDLRGIASDGAGNLYAAGECAGAIDFGLDIMLPVPPGGESICMARLPP